MFSQHDTLTAEAAAYAIRQHDGQYRKGSGFPYIVHPIGVGHLLRNWYPGNEELEAAGYLHDTIEDTSTEYIDLEHKFGPRVAGLVYAVTRVPGWNLADYRNNPDVLRLKGADMVDNIRDTVRGIEKGHDVWTRFAAGKRKWRSWEKDYNIIVNHLGDVSGNNELLIELTRVVMRANPNV